MLEASIVLSMGIMLKFDFFSQKILGSHVIVVQGLTIWWQQMLYGSFEWNENKVQSDLWKLLINIKIGMVNTKIC